MPLALVVPAEDQRPENLFQFTLIVGGQTIHRWVPRDFSHRDWCMADLRLLAKKVGLSGHGRLRKAQLARELQGVVFFNTHEEAVAKYPILAEPIATTEEALIDQRNRLGSLVGSEGFLYFAHICKKYEEAQAALRTVQMEAERARWREAEAAKQPPDWWEAGNFVRMEDWEEPGPECRPYLEITVRVTERSHDGYCSGIEEDPQDGHFFHFMGGDVEIEETSYFMTGKIPLRDEQGRTWDFFGPDFDPGWRCASGGSGVCNVRPSVSFLSMSRID